MTQVYNKTIIALYLDFIHSYLFCFYFDEANACGTLKCENAAICEKVAKCEKNSTLNVKIDAICEKITLNVKK